MSFIADLRFAFRSFSRAKGIALTVIVTLALGIGANAAMFSRHLLTRVLGEGAVIAAAGIVAGVLAGLALTRFAGALFGVVQMPGVLPVAGAATLLVTAAILASLLPAARASRVDVLQALRSD